MFNIDAYLERINYQGKKDITKETLYNLHTAHTLQVPFENLDVYYGREIPLDIESLFQKIVVKKRGGYCFEMNGLFSFVLKDLGFKVIDLLAKSIMDDGVTQTSKTHQIMVVEAEGKKWLVDVGYGRDGIIAPLELNTGEDQKQFAHIYRLMEHPIRGYILEKKVNDKYIPMYAFTLDECTPMDYLMSNHFTATFPESFFIKMKFCTIPTKEGRITLTDDKLSIIEDNNVTEKLVEDDTEFKELLQKYFGLDLNEVQNL